MRSDLAEMLNDLTAQDGFLKWTEGEEPYPYELIEHAIDLGLVDCHGSGGMASTDVVMTLTRTGRLQLGLPDKPNIVERAALWLHAIAARMT